MECVFDTYSYSQTLELERSLKINIIVNRTFFSLKMEIMDNILCFFLQIENRYLVAF